MGEQLAHFVLALRVLEVIMIALGILGAISIARRPRAMRISVFTSLTRPSLTVAFVTEAVVFGNVLLTGLFNSFVLASGRLPVTDPAAAPMPLPIRILNMTTKAASGLMLAALLLCLFVAVQRRSWIWLSVFVVALGTWIVISDPLGLLLLDMLPPGSYSDTDLSALGLSWGDTLSDNTLRDVSVFALSLVFTLIPLLFGLGLLISDLMTLVRLQRLGATPAQSIDRLRNEATRVSDAVERMCMRAVTISLWMLILVPVGTLLTLAPVRAIISPSAQGISNGPEPFLVTMFLPLTLLLSAFATETWLFVTAALLLIAAAQRNQWVWFVALLLATFAGPYLLAPLLSQMLPSWLKVTLPPYVAPDLWAAFISYPALLGYFRVRLSTPHTAGDMGAVATTPPPESVQERSRNHPSNG